MKLIASSLLVVVFTSLSLLGCGDDQDPAGAKRLLNQVRADEYRMWDRAPGYESRRSSNAPHGGAVDIYVNDVLTDALMGSVAISEWPVGSIIVKDGFDGNDLDLIAMMEKRDSGWFWAEFDSDGDSLYSGRPSLCIDCHRRGADFVRAFSFP